MLSLIAVTLTITAGNTPAAASVAAAAPVAVQAAAPGDTVAASSLPSLLTERADDTSHTYSRDQFTLWIDADGDGCDTRAEVLIAESTTPITPGAGCSLTGGSWLSPYDGETWTSPSDVDIDHLVPLKDAWISGAWSWTPAQRTQYANDLDVPYALIAVTDNVNQSKGDRDPAQWMPPAAGFDCEYAIDWVLVKYRWSLTADPAERAALASQLSGTCGSTTVTLPARQIATTAPTTQTVIAPFADGITRVYGTDRYATALTASQRYAPGVPAVFVATGANFPDALAAASAASLLGGPLLLTPADRVPANVAAEVRRLAPEHVFVVGGTGAVSNAALAALAAIAPTTRLGGTDRYATGLTIVNTAFTQSANAIIATGRGFADALTATGAAGSIGAPVILVDGSARSVPSTTLATLSRLGVTTIGIAGGAGAVSDGILNQLRGAGYGVTRYGGADRYDTSAVIYRGFFPAGATHTFLATGTNFPDALAGAALAGRLGAPMFSAKPNCVPASVHDAIAGTGATKHVVMGGPGVVGDAAAANAVCASAPPPPAQNVYPDPVTAGAFCASAYAGWIGYTSTGIKMVCSTSPTDSRLRWRKA